jgi:hypothetical protein
MPVWIANWSYQPKGFTNVRGEIRGQHTYCSDFWGIGIVSPYLPHNLPLPPGLRYIRTYQPWVCSDGYGLVTVRAVLDRIPHFAELLATTQDQDFEDLRLAEGSGRPLGTAEFVAGLERLLGRPIVRRAPGRKPAASVTGIQLKLPQ